jgi:F0F1-type ATP synthase membrane subunit c/vacuolar-type H+-ATPase subunit K
MDESRSWLPNNPLLSFVLQQLMSTIGSLLLGTALVLVPALLTAALRRNSSGGNFIDHVVEQPSFRWAGRNQVFVVAGLILGLLSVRFFQRRSAAWVWVLPLLVLIWNIFSWKNGGYRPYWPDVWDNYFGSHCSASECLYELFVTTLFYASVAYTFGWLVATYFSKRWHKHPA